MVDSAAPELRVLSRPECVRLLGSTAVGRIGVSIAALPVILPVNFAVFDGSILFRTGRGTKLAAATQNAVVAFEADGFQPDGTVGWSVLVRGICSEVTDHHELERMRRVPLDSWVADGDTDRYVLISLTEISGRRFDATA
ncbi:MAG TPA: pyridoxamine 5'-phosphate oxidase family protein [Actinomycetes bacterium]|jgi:nitroimidazol reductase NimA-like FMN-containing flavoprotein (pyridoxamine 5'-phosphate oxidase superfamily)